MESSRTGLFSEKMFCLYNQGASQLEAQDGRIKPVKIYGPVGGLIHERVEQLVLRSGVIAEDELLISFVQNQLFLLAVHCVYIT